MNLEERIGRLEHYLSIAKRWNHTEKIKRFTSKLNRLKIIAKRNKEI
jgi:hypothetical protein|tara:strand:- start:253 stop:393 length:141 start_codon:yes stop_codon:yes gene_type:complete